MFLMNWKGAKCDVSFMDEGVNMWIGVVPKLKLALYTFLAEKDGCE